MKFAGDIFDARVKCERRDQSLSDIIRECQVTSYRSKIQEFYGQQTERNIMILDISFI